MGYTGAYDLGNGLDVDPDDSNEEPIYCEQCGAEMDYVDCWLCNGEGGFDLHEIYPIVYADGEFEQCNLCNGEGGYLECPNLPHIKKGVK